MGCALPTGRRTSTSTTGSIPAEDPSGAVALGPLALACLAHDGGIPIDVESDYLPKHLLQRGWLGEFEI
ncbi:Imm49 family immunity protein [Streptomyces longwoodensis]|uniref:Imm49 family immunity protein n=1 Tax=Streptomyces longwoodensis TaxID=68231 RepID=UPI0033F8C5CB